VLAGGASSRFGCDKALVTFRGQTLLSRLCALARGAARPVNVVGAADKYETSGVSCIADLWPGEGPLGGIVTALQATTKFGNGCSWNLIIGCDMPFLTREWLMYLVQSAVASSSHVALPKSSHGLEPLCACWRTSALARLQVAFDQGTRKVTEAMKHLRMEILDETHWKRFDNAGRLFWNMNTQADYEEARRLLEAEQS
jgi:molybdopterin-guanine dinucleotide biosynthesis protein A